jgi:NAD(P)H dehydrogenase (quinone)
MGKVLVLYDSATGHTKRMAELVAEGAVSVPETEVRLRFVEEAAPDDVAWCDGIAVGSPTNMGVLSWKMKRFWDDTLNDLWGHIDGKIGCAFSSSGGIGGGGELACQSMMTVMMNFGFLVFGVTDYVAKGWTLHYGAINAGEPREEKELEACRRLGKRLAQWVAVAEGRRDMHPLAEKPNE